MYRVNAQAVLSRDDIVIAEENFTNWRIAWKKLRIMINKGQCKNKMESLKAKKLQSEIPLKYDEEDYGWLMRYTNPRKTASIFSLQEQMVEIRAWKKLRGLIDDEICRVCRKTNGIVQHLLAGCQKPAGTEHVRRHNNALKVLAVWWAVKNGLLLERTKWYGVRREKGTAIERDGKKLLWDWEHRMPTNCTAIYTRRHRKQSSYCD